MVSKIGMATAMVAASLFVGSARAQDASPGWPQQPIRWIVPYAAGGNTDGVSRAIGKRLSESLKQTVIIENRAGGDTIIGTTALVQAAPDGYTIGLIADTLGIHAATNKQTPYDAMKDLEPIVQLTRVPFTLIANAETVAAKDLPGFIAEARKKPGAVSFASIGPGSPHEIGFLWFQSLANFKATIVPYRGIAPGLQDLLSGQVNVMFWGGVATQQYVETGKVRRLAVTTREALSAAPEAMPIASLYPEYVFETWYGMAAPRGTPKPIIDRLNKEINLVLQTDEIKKLIDNYGFLGAGGAPDVVSKRISDDMIKYKKLADLISAK